MPEKDTLQLENSWDSVILFALEKILTLNAQIICRKNFQKRRFWAI